jgi:type I restriction enzyme S subunit
VSDLPKGWVWAGLAQVCTSITDGDHQPPPQVSVGIPFLVIGNVRGQVIDFAGCRYVSSAYFESLNPIRRPQKGDVLYTLVGSYGISVLVKDDKPFCIQRHIGIIRPSREIDPSFLALAMSTHAVFDQASRCATGTAQLTVPLSGLRRINIPFPPRPEQDRIVAAVEEQLSRLDAGRALLERVQHNLDRMRYVILDGLLSGSNGQTWKSVALGEVLERGRYGTSTKCAYDGTGPPVLRIPNIQSGELDLRDLKHAIDPGVDLGRSIVARGDVLIVRTNGSRSLIGRAAVVPAQDQALSFASYLIQLKVNRVLLNPQYLVAALAAPKVRMLVERLAATTAGQYNISLDKLRSLKIPLPPLEDQITLLAVANHRLSVIAAVESDLASALRRHERLCSSILTAAFAGRLTRQDPRDEPASVLLDRIAVERAASNGDRRGRGTTPRTKVGV